MSFFPFMQDVEEKTFLVIGRGAIARRKIRLLRQFTDRILTAEDFQQSDLEQADYCIASTDDRAENSRIAALCREAGIPVNVPDDPSACTFYLPAVIKRGDLVIAVSTSGSSPAMSRMVRQQIEALLPDRTEDILDRMKELREWVPEKIPKSSDRAKIYWTILQLLMSRALAPDPSPVTAEAERLIREYRRP